MHLTDKLKKPAAAGPSFLSFTVQFVKQTSHFEERIDLLASGGAAARAAEGEDEENNEHFAGCWGAGF